MRRTFSPYAYEFHEDPYPIYRWLRDEAPAYWNDELRFWALSRYDDVLRGFQDWETFSNRAGVSLEQSEFGEPEQTTFFLAMDPPRHDRLRALVSRAFTGRRVEALEPRIRELARRYAARVAPQGACDFIGDFSARLPMDVISEMLGVPEEERDELRTWADLVVHREDGLPHIPPQALEASAKLIHHFAGMVEERRSRPQGGLVEALLEAEVDGERLSDRDVISFLFLMIIAGNETTTKLLGNALYWLAKNPEQRQLVERDRSLIPRWVEETLRYDNSSQILGRILTREIELHGQKLREGDRVLLLVGSANRDERAFADPDRFDILRDTSGHLSFGKGIHFCLGARLARLEARLGLETALEAFPEFEIDEAGIRRVHSSNVRGFASLPIRFRAGGLPDAG